MKNVRKFASITLAATLLVSIMATGCGSKTDGPAGTAAPTGDAGAAPTAKAVEYPTKPIQLIVPVKAGGDTDYNARVLAKSLEKHLGKPVVVTNVDGGATVTGMKQVLDADPDGYNVIVNGTDIFVPKMMGTTDISLDSFKTVGIPLIDNTTVIAVNKASGFTKLTDMVEAAKKGDLEYGMKIGATNQICGVSMDVEWGTKFKHVDVGNNAAKMTALLAKQTDVININYSLARDYFKTGEFIPLVLLGDEKNQLLSDLPIASDAGLKNLNYSKFFWLGMHPDTPDEIVNIFAEAMKKATEDPEYKGKMEENYLTVKFMGPKDAEDFAMKLYKDTMEPYKEAFLAAQ